MLQNAIQQAVPVSSITTYGPYDPEPTGTADPREGLLALQHRIEQLQTFSENLLARTQTSLPPDVLAEVKKYYQTQINSLTAELPDVERAGKLSLFTPEELQQELAKDPNFLDSFLPKH